MIPQRPRKNPDTGPRHPACEPAVHCPPLRPVPVAFLSLSLAGHPCQRPRLSDSCGLEGLWSRVFIQSVYRHQGSCAAVCRAHGMAMDHSYPDLGHPSTSRPPGCGSHSHRAFVAQIALTELPDIGAFSLVSEATKAWPLVLCRWHWVMMDATPWQDCPWRAMSKERLAAVSLSCFIAGSPMAFLFYSMLV